MHRDHPANDWSTVVVDGAQLVDVRQPEEVAGGTIDGAVNIPLDQLPDRVRELEPSRRVVLLCRSGARSASAAEFLTASGFTDVINLSGGMLLVGADG